MHMNGEGEELKGREFIRTYQEAAPGGSRIAHEHVFNLPGRGAEGGEWMRRGGYAPKGSGTRWSGSSNCRCCCAAAAAEP
jgi:hypothetical protein